MRIQGREGATPVQKKKKKKKKNNVDEPSVSASIRAHASSRDSGGSVNEGVVLSAGAPVSRSGRSELAFVDDGHPRTYRHTYGMVLSLGCFNSSVSP